MSDIGPLPDVSLPDISLPGISPPDMSPPAGNPAPVPTAESGAGPETPAPTPNEKTGKPLIDMDIPQANATMDKAAGVAKKLVPDDIEPEKAVSAIDAIVEAAKAWFSIVKEHDSKKGEKSGADDKEEPDNSDEIYGISKSTLAEGVDLAVDAGEKVVDALDDPEERAKMENPTGPDGPPSVIGMIKIGVADAVSEAVSFLKPLSEELKKEEPTPKDFVENGLKCVSGFFEAAKDMCVAAVTNDMDAMLKAGDKLNNTVANAMMGPEVGNKEDPTAAPQMDKAFMQAPSPEPSGNSVQTNSVKSSVEAPAPQGPTPPTPEAGTGMSSRGGGLQEAEPEMRDRSQAVTEASPGGVEGASQPIHTTDMPDTGTRERSNATSAPKPSPMDGMAGRASKVTSNLGSMSASANDDPGVKQSEQHSAVNKEDNGFHPQMDSSIHNGEGQFANYQKQNAEDKQKQEADLATTNKMDADASNTASSMPKPSMGMG